jgi:hypothetical protein
MQLENFEEVRPPAALAGPEEWFVTALDGVVSTHRDYRLVTVWELSCKCLALDFVPRDSSGVYAAVHRLAYSRRMPSMLYTDRSALCGSLVTAAVSLPRVPSVAWSSASQEHRAAIDDLVAIGRRLSASHQFSFATIQSVFDGWRKRFNRALDGYVSPELLDGRRVRPDWFEMLVEGLQSESASMALSTLHTHTPSADARFREKSTAAEGGEAQDSTNTWVSVKRPLPTSRLTPTRSRIAEEVLKSMRFTKA